MTRIVKLASGKLNRTGHNGEGYNWISTGIIQPITFCAIDVSLISFLKLWLLFLCTTVCSQKRFVSQYYGTMNQSTNMRILFVSRSNYYISTRSRSSQSKVRLEHESFLYGYGSHKVRISNPSGISGDFKKEKKNIKLSWMFIDIDSWVVQLRGNKIKFSLIVQKDAYASVGLFESTNLISPNVENCFHWF